MSHLVSRLCLVAVSLACVGCGPFREPGNPYPGSWLIGTMERDARPKGLARRRPFVQPTEVFVWLSQRPTRLRGPLMVNGRAVSEYAVYRCDLLGSEGTGRMWAIVFRHEGADMPESGVAVVELDGGRSQVRVRRLDSDGLYWTNRTFRPPETQKYYPALRSGPLYTRIYNIEEDFPITFPFTLVTIDGDKVWVTGTAPRWHGR